MLQFKVLIWKLPATDGLSSSAIVVGEIATLKVWCSVRVAPPLFMKAAGEMTLYLAHELRDDTVKYRSLVAEAMFSCAERPEVLCKTHGVSDSLCTDSQYKTFCTYLK